MAYDPREIACPDTRTAEEYEPTLRLCRSHLEEGEARMFYPCGVEVSRMRAWLNGGHLMASTKKPCVYGIAKVVTDWQYQGLRRIRIQCGCGASQDVTHLPMGFDPKGAAYPDQHSAEEDEPTRLLCRSHLKEDEVRMFYPCGVEATRLIKWNNKGHLSAYNGEPCIQGITQVVSDFRQGFRFIRIDCGCGASQQVTHMDHH